MAISHRIDVVFGDSTPTADTDPPTDTVDAQAATDAAPDVDAASDAPDGASPTTIKPAQREKE